MKVRQFELVEAAMTSARSRLVCWLADDPRLLRRGVRVRLKELPTREWVVERAYRTVHDDGEINRRWKVGGLR